ncbi:MAG: ribose 5-phosphate isomerase A, partial [Candidatus Micrarchaeota archaeon]
MTGNEKEDAARKALRYVKTGMVVGLGTGSTAAYFIKLLGEKNKEKNLKLTCIATSVQSEQLAQECGLKLATFRQLEYVDLAVDGADLIVGKLLIKGLGGGAITREKIVDYKAKKFIVIADRTKVRGKFAGIVPVEAIPFA